MVKIKLIKINATVIPIGTIEKIDICIELVLTFNIITTNKKSTAMAPTYIIKNIKEKNSAPKINNKLATLQKTIIKKRTECTALDKVTTIRAGIKIKNAKIWNKIKSIFILFLAKDETWTHILTLAKLNFTFKLLSLKTKFIN